MIITPLNLNGAWRRCKDKNRIQYFKALINICLRLKEGGERGR